jgi:SnoaL-like domain
MRERNDKAVPRDPSREELVTGLIRLGEQELTGEDEAEVDACFAPDFAFHGPDGAEMDYEGLKGYFASLRAAFDDLTISRGIMVVEGDYVACQTTIAGTFAREFTRSPVGRLPPNGSRACSSSSTSSDTTTRDESRRNGCRRTTEAGCVSWALKVAEQHPR